METFTFTSFDNRQLRGYVAKASEEKAVVQFIHGASDRIDRYEEFAHYLQENGVSFYGIDNRGHGKSETKRGPYVYLEPGDHEAIIQDQQFFHKYILQQTNQPIFLVGHSMGSLLARVLITREGGYRGVFVIGTGYRNPIRLKAEELVAKAAIKAKGWDTYSKRIDKLGLEGQVDEMIKKGYIRKKWQWVTTDPVKQQQTSLDLKLAKRFTLGSYMELCHLMQKTMDTEAMKVIDPALPMIFMSGLMDPVGGYGKDVRKAAELYKDHSDARIKLYLYKGLRHELLQEINRYEIFDLILTKIAEILEGNWVA